MQDYPDWLLEHMIAQPETIDWVVEYPEYMKKSEEEINQIALEPVDLEQYEIHGQIPIFYQWTSTWGYAKYGEEQIAIDGCGPTCLAMETPLIRQRKWPISAWKLGPISLTPEQLGI